MDDRVQSPIRQFLADEFGLTNDPFRVSHAGGCLPLCEHVGLASRAFVLTQIEIAVRSEHIRRVIVINHERCTAYGAFSTTTQEWERHAADLAFARQLILGRFPALDVHCFFATDVDAAVTILPVDTDRLITSSQGT